MAQGVTAEQIQNAKKHVYKVIGVVPLLDVKEHREMLLEMADTFLWLLDTWARDDPEVKALHRLYREAKEGHIK